MYEDSLDRLPQETARDFSPFLQRDTHTIPLSDIEKRAERLIENMNYIDALIIRKTEPDGSAKTLYPALYDLVHPFEFPPDQNPLVWHQQPVLDSNGEYIGDIYLKLNTTKRYLYLTAVIISFILIAVLNLYGIYTFQVQEKAVLHTTGLLEEKQRELIHLERLALVGQITASLLHDIKKPVLNIRSEVEQAADFPEKQSIQEETDFFLQLIRELQLEGFIRKDTQKAEFLDISEVVERSLRLVRYAQDGVRVEYHFPDNMPFIFGHRHQLIQVFSNLMLNAFQALEGEGTVRIYATLLFEEDSTWLEVSMTDDGPGMPVEMLAQIFEPFVSSGRAEESTGLGLYITRSIVESMGGKIEVHSIPKHGTTFTLRFPVSEEELM